MPRLPHLDFNLTPNNQHPAVHLTSVNLLFIGSRLNDFGYALELFSATSQQTPSLDRADVRKAGDTQTYLSALHRLAAWKLMAARDGALTLYHFGRAAEATRNNLHFCPALKATVDLITLKAALKQFETAFPKWEAIRHSVAHQGDLTRTDEQLKKHGLRSPYNCNGMVSGKGGLITNSLNGDVYIVSWEGEVFTYRINRSNLETLCGIADQIYKAFDAKAGFDRHF